MIPTHIFILVLIHYLLDWTSESFNEDIDIRAYGKSERTRELVIDNMQEIQRAFQDHDLVANVRLETYDGEKYFHLPPKKGILDNIFMRYYNTHFLLITSVLDIYHVVRKGLLLEKELHDISGASVQSALLLQT